MLIHVRKYDRRNDGTLFPTKKGIALNLEKWKKLQYCHLENIHSALDQYRDSKPVDFLVHFGGNYHVSGKSGGGRVVRWCWVNFQCRGVLPVWVRVGQGPTALAVGAGGGCLDIFSLVCQFSLLSPPWEKARYRLKYCLKGPQSPKQPTKSVKSGFPLVNIRRWFIPEGRQELTPTKTGIALTFLQWEKIKSAVTLVEELLNGELDKVSFCEESHQNQEGALTCSNCNPKDFMNY